MTDQATEKQHHATGKRIADLRKQGQVMRSKDLTSGLVFIVCVMMLLSTSNQIKITFQNNFIHSFAQIQSVLKYPDFPLYFVRQLALDNLLVLLPIFLVALIVVFLSPFFFGGWNFTFQALHFNLAKLNPIANLGQLFSKKMGLNVIKSILKVSVIMSVLVFFAISKKAVILRLIGLPYDVSLMQSLSITRQFIILISSSLILIIAYDVVTNYFEFTNRIKMTSQELKDEHKDTEGNTDVKRKLRSMQLTLLKQRLFFIVPKATVVITNPTHYAVAIKYDDKTDKAPTVIAKGKDFIAQQIRELAVANGVQIYQAPELARAMFKTSKLNAEINPGLYMAVAIVLSYVHQLKNYQHGLGNQPQVVSDLKIPEHLVFDEV